MKGFVCLKANECLLAGEEFCGLARNAPIASSYKPNLEEGERLECYVQHILLCWDEWRALKRRIMGPVSRAVSSVLQLSKGEVMRELDRLLDLMVLNHDIGKLTRVYQNYCLCDDLRTFRHEHVSSYFVSRLLKYSHSPPLPTLRSLICSAIYLHHEALVTSWRSPDLTWLRVPTADYLLAHMLRFSRDDLEFIPYAYEIVDELNWCVTNVRIRRDILSGPLDVRDIVRELSEMVSFIDGPASAPEMRLASASILLPLTFVDNRAGARGRGR